VRQIDIDEAMATLSQLVEAAEAGEKVILARAGKPVVQLVRVKAQHGIKLGVLKGKLPEQLLDDVASPTSRADVEALFGTRLEP
jgi:antitoxin (DNA-binding transcriptional repressor) of toxin-antitoxin stability system